MLRRPGAVRRWLVTIVVACLLAALPGIVTHWPVSGSTPSAAATMKRALRSAGVPFQGYVQASGAMEFPTIGLLATTAHLLGTSSQIRVWQARPDVYRVDLLAATGERDTYRAGQRQEVWDFDHQRLTVTHADDGPHLPAPYDITPPALGRRLLAYADPRDVRSDGLVRTAGRHAVRLVVVPHDERTLVGTIEVDVDTASGLPLAVSVTPRGAHTPAQTTSFAEISLSAPSAAVLTFSATPGIEIRYDGQPTLTELAQRVGPAALPDALAGLRWRSSTGGVATYGEGFALVTVVPLSGSDAAALVSRLDSPLQHVQQTPDGDVIALETPLVTGVIVSMPGRGFAVAGTVTRSTINAVVHALAVS